MRLSFIFLAALADFVQTCLSRGSVAAVAMAACVSLELDRVITVVVSRRKDECRADAHYRLCSTYENTALEMTGLNLLN